MFGVPRHEAVHVDLRRRYGENGQHFDKISQRRAALERMRAVDVKETSAVGAQLLDSDLRRGRPHRENLFWSFQSRQLDVG